MICEAMFALWRAQSDGGRYLVPKAWGGKFPFQAKVELATPDITEVPKQVIDDFVVNESTGRLDNIIEESKTENLIQALRGITEISERP